jgi:hypothetical protein
MGKKLAEFVDIIRQDPAVGQVDGFFYGWSCGEVFVVLEPLSKRQVSSQEVANRLPAGTRSDLGRRSGFWSGSGSTHRRPSEPLTQLRSRNRIEENAPLNFSPFPPAEQVRAQ